MVAVNKEHSICYYLHQLLFVIPPPLAKLLSVPHLVLSSTVAGSVSKQRKVIRRSSEMLIITESSNCIVYAPIEQRNN